MASLFSLFLSLFFSTPPNEFFQIPPSSDPVGFAIFATLGSGRGYGCGSRTHPMGPPAAQVISAIGEMVSTCARLESLTKKYDCRVIISWHAAEAAGLDVKHRKLQRASVIGLSQPVEFYALDSLANFRV
jgi:hypothetical protein